MTSRALTYAVAAIPTASILAFAPAIELSGLSRFTAAKELVVLVLAGLAAALALLRARRIAVHTVDALLLAMLALTATSALAVAVDPVIAWRVTAMTAAGLAIFWCARCVDPRIALGAVTAAAAIGAASVILEAHGVLSLSLPQRNPGGTEGHRNFMAHALALALPAALALAATPRTTRSRVLAIVAVVAITVAITLSRSRTAWVAAAVGVVVLVALAWRIHRRGSALALVTVALATAAAVLVPNQLDWASSSPYADTTRSLAEFSTGSGRGRVVQYRTTARMIADAPWLGVGPGHWSIAYPAFARQPDANYTPLGIEPVSKLANADWLPFAAERGVPGALLLAGAGVLLVLGYRRALRSHDRIPAAVALAALATVCVAGTFDSVLTRPTPLVLLAVIAGAGIAGLSARRTFDLRIGPALAGAALALALVCATRPAISISAMYLHEGGDLDAQLAAAERDPSAYEIHVVLALSFMARSECGRARDHARLALDHYPHHLLARRVIERCGTRVTRS